MTLEKSKEWWISRARREGDAPVAAGAEPDSWTIEIDFYETDAAPEALYNAIEEFVYHLHPGFSGVISMRGAAPDPVTTFRQAADAFTAQHTASEDAANACLVGAGIQDASGDLTAEYQENPAAGEKDEA